MTKRVHFKRVIWGCLVAVVAVSATAPTLAPAAGPVQQAYFEPDYEASGFVAPAGMPAPDAYFQSVQQAGFFGNGPIASRLSGGQSAYGYDGQPIYGYGGCDGCDGCADGSCGQGACGPGGCGLLGGCGMLGCGPEGCGHGGCLSRMSRLCMFCGGGGCGVCQSIGRGYLLGALRALLPYTEAGLSAQRWYDLSADVMILETSSGTSNRVLTTRGKAGTPVLRADSADDDFTAGGRISGAFIFGPGGNIEVTYLGGNRWSGDATATGDGDLYSFLSEFGTAPDEGYPQSDRSYRQSVTSEATFHSGEVNYRRRTVGPYGRFQWSGLGGIRYLRFDSDFEYSALGDEGLFLLSNNLDNDMVGAQIGGDLWWNLFPGINIGIGGKGGPMGNHISRRALASGTSLGPGGTSGELTEHEAKNRTAWLSEMEATLLYRISHSWTLKGQYYLLHVDRVGYGFDTSPADNFISDGSIPIDPISTRSLTIRGFSIGAEYIW